LQKVHPGRFLEQGEGPDIFRGPGMHLHLTIFDSEDGIKPNVCLGVGIPAAKEIRINLKMGPAPGFQFIAQTGRGEYKKQLEEKTSSDKNIHKT
jgi:hypothetical protein